MRTVGNWRTIKFWWQELCCCSWSLWQTWSWWIKMHCSHKLSSSALEHSLWVSVSLQQPNHPWAIIPKDHNLHNNSIGRSNIGLLAALVLDKTLKFAHSIKHRLVQWKKLPSETCQIVELYKEHRTKGYNFFCKLDGRPLIRNNFLNLLNVCLTQMDRYHIAITPHCFRQGHCSQEGLDGVPIEQIMHNGHWSKTVWP